MATATIKLSVAQELLDFTTALELEREKVEIFHKILIEIHNGFSKAYVPKSIILIGNELTQQLKGCASLYYTISSKIAFVFLQVFPPFSILYLRDTTFAWIKTYMKEYIDYVFIINCSVEYRKYERVVKIVLSEQHDDDQKQEILHRMLFNSEIPSTYAYDSKDIWFPLRWCVLQQSIKNDLIISETFDDSLKNKAVIGDNLQNFLPFFKNKSNLPNYYFIMDIDIGFSVF